MWEMDNDGDGVGGLDTRIAQEIRGSSGAAGSGEGGAVEDIRDNGDCLSNSA